MFMYWTWWQLFAPSMATELVFEGGDWAGRAELYNQSYSVLLVLGWSWSTDLMLVSLSVVIPPSCSLYIAHRHTDGENSLLVTSAMDHPWWEREICWNMKHEMSLSWFCFQPQVWFATPQRMPQSTSSAMNMTASIPATLPTTSVRMEPPSAIQIFNVLDILQMVK